MPVVTIIGVDVGFLFTGSVLVEPFSAGPGIGRLMYESIVKRTIRSDGKFSNDYRAGRSGDLLVDLIYLWLDPRVKYQK